MATAKETRNQFHDNYKIIIGRNRYNQNLRSYVYTPHGGNYYSDCSSSICAAMSRSGVTMSMLNTAGMYHSPIWKRVEVSIRNGHVSASDIGKLQIGDALMFRGNDASRPLQIGHVEAVYEINGSSESDVTLCGHGSGTPSTKNLKTYCTSRENSRASNGKTKGLVCVLRCISDDTTTDSTSSSVGNTTVSNGSSSGNKTYLSIGDSSASVKEMQKMLIKIGYNCGKFGADGSFGKDTDAALRNMQKAHKLTVDGKYGKRSKEKLSELYKETINNNPTVVNGYKVGKTYTLQYNMKVRTGAGTNYAAKRYSELTTDGKKHATSSGVMKAGTKVTCKSIKINGKDIWLQTPSGWIAAVYRGKTYVK